ncbi:MAG: 30S ribosome-binding factor RbfA [Rhodospirillaceae bacterium]|jgi:ribosome-binding factor A|nr:30S ribosome-binding factor RbfA [Rhodospirillaceae bacterium]MBT5374019.1 30S ribosome-binding factor RbfA [Rhodospirillaceae bacterium]MBT5660143.1 30S ribosome-binding factor RbfA [Rhodospirillaceae bacterium]MBT5751172.1 30S ribosome-binding factor RbfA [Rhodospirillaceae bacterium]
MARHRGKSRSPRQLRVGEELRHILADVLERGDMLDPDLRNVKVTVTEVRVSPDLKNATAFIVPLGGAPDPAASQALLEAFTRAAPFFRRHVAKVAQLRFTPKIGFRVDASFDAGGRIDALLREPDIARDLGPIIDEEEPKVGDEVPRAENSDQTESDG